MYFCVKGRHPYSVLQNDTGYIDNVIRGTSVNTTEYFEKNGIKAVKIHEIDTLLGYNIKIKIEGNGGTPQCT